MTVYLSENVFWHRCLYAQSCLTLWDPWAVAHSLGSSVHGIFQARIPEWVAISYSRGSSLSRDWSSALAGRFFTTEPVKSENIFVLP